MLDEANRLKPTGRVRYVKKIVRDVPLNRIVRWKGEYGVLLALETPGKRGRRFDSWEGPPVKLFLYEVVEVLELSRKVQTAPSDEVAKLPRVAISACPNTVAA